jgi:hypothetical protein
MRRKRLPASPADAAAGNFIENPNLTPGPRRRFSLICEHAPRCGDAASSECWLKTTHDPIRVAPWLDQEDGPISNTAFKIP